MTPIDLFHGTTLEAAERILEVGWWPQDVLGVVKRVAAECGASLANILADLEGHGRFVQHADRGTYASFTPDRVKAEHSWAQRAPEAQWEALWAVWRVHHLSSSENCNQDLAGHAWVWERCKLERLAVIRYSTSYEELQDLGALSGGFGVRPLVPANVLPRTAEVAISAPFCPSRDRLTVIEVERHVPFDVFAFLLGITVERFRDLQEAGEFGVPASQGSRHSYGDVAPWWTTKFVANYLSKYQSEFDG